MTKPAIVEMPEREPDSKPETTTLAVETNPATAGMDYLRGLGVEPLRLWTVKTPKGQGGTVSAVFLQATSEVAILQQFASGRFVVFRKSAD
jgi:hypothetical protein